MPSKPGPALEVPPEVRAIAEKSVEQARKALDGFLVAAHKAVDDAEDRMGAMQASAREASRAAVDYAEQNIIAGFDFASNLAKAKTLDEVMKLQADFASSHAKRLAEQAKVLGEKGATFARDVASKAKV